MTRIIQIIVLLPGLLFTVMGLRFAFDPEGALAGLKMDMLEGVGRNSQIGDGGGMFLGLGLMILLGLLSKNKVWFQAVALVLALVALFRVLASVLHDATLAPEMVGVELVVAVIMLVAARRLTSA